MTWPRGRWLRSVALAAAFLPIAVAGAAATRPSLPPPPADYFNDAAGLVPAETARRFEARLRGIERQSGSQVVVAVFRKLPFPPLEDFTVRTAQAWRVGRKGLDNGVVLFVFVDDRKLRLEVGYGLEDKIPDAVARRIVDDVIAPRFKAGQFESGIEAGIGAIERAIAGTLRLPAPAPARPRAPASSSDRTTGFLIVGLLFLFSVPMLAALVAIVQGRIRGERRPSWGRAFLIAAPLQLLLTLAYSLMGPGERTLDRGLERGAGFEAVSSAVILLLCLLAGFAPALTAFARRAWISGLLAAVAAAAAGVAMDRGGVPRLAVMVLSLCLLGLCWALLRALGLWLPTLKTSARARRQAAVAVGVLTVLGLIGALAGPVPLLLAILLGVFVFVFVAGHFATAGSRGATWSSSGKSRSSWSSSSSSSSSGFRGGGGRFGGGGASGSW